MAATFLLLTVFAHATPTKLGDLDDDGVFTANDLAKLVGHSSGTTPLLSNLQPFADLTQDGFVNDADLDSLVSLILESSTPQNLPLASIREVSPASGEGDVAVTRETVLHFSMPLALNASIDTSKLFAEFGGRKILSRVELSSDRKKATLFYLEPLPSNARIRVSFDSTGVNDLLNRAIDGDGDGLAGGSYITSFDTLSITAVAGTAISGRVFASERGTGGNEVPLAGVTVTVDGAEQTLRTTTDALGNFTLSPCPAGSFFVHIDGRTSPQSAWPGGDYYPNVGKRWEALAGRTDNLSGNPEDTSRGTFYLPKVLGAALQTVSQSQDTKVDFPPAILADNPALAGTELDVPANSLFADDGTRGGRVGIAPVAPDRLPSPLPPGLNLPMVITIQTDGATNFDRPVPICFPNLPDPVTGVKLPPGAKSALWSFNHDLGDWEVVGPMTVTEDGNFVKTDAGVGVMQPGWHGQRPGVPGNDGPIDMPTPDTDDGEDESDHDHHGEPDFGKPPPPPPTPEQDDPPKPEDEEDEEGCSVQIFPINLGLGGNTKAANIDSNGRFEVYPVINIAAEAQASPPGGTFLWNASSDMSPNQRNVTGDPFGQSSFSSQVGHLGWFTTKVVTRKITVTYTAPNGKTAKASVSLAVIPVSGFQWYYEFIDAAIKYQNFPLQAIGSLDRSFSNDVAALYTTLYTAATVDSDGVPIATQPAPPKITSTFRPHARSYLMYSSQDAANNPQTSARMPQYQRPSNLVFDTVSYPFRISWAHYKVSGEIDRSKTRLAALDMLSDPYYDITTTSKVSRGISNHNVGRAIDFSFSWSGNLELVLPAINGKPRRFVVISSSPKMSGTLGNAGNYDLEEIIHQHFGIQHYAFDVRNNRSAVAKDGVHWSAAANGR